MDTQGKLREASRPAVSRQKRPERDSSLRCAQNDSMADECADVRLSSAIEPLAAGGIENGIIQQG
jgi:hypothetical protein